MPQTIDKLIVEIGATKKGLEKQINDLKKDIKRVDKTVKKSEGTFNSLSSTIVAAFSVAAVVGFGKAVIQTLGEFQKMEAVLTNTLGSNSAAKKAMDDIMVFASRTPFAVKELTDSYVKLANQGIKPSMSDMTALGDIAASTGKTFDQLGEAVIDAATGFEFERLKEFGIRAKKDGDKVAFTFKGVTTEVKATTATINDYIIGLGQAEGVTGGMAAISETTAGKISNMGDNYDTFLKVVGEGNSGIIADAIDGLNNLVSSINETEKATQRAAELGFKRGLFQELKGAAMQMMALDNAVKANVRTFDEQGTTITQVKNAIRQYLTEAKSLDTSTDEGKAKLKIYSDAMLSLKDRLTELKKPTIEATKDTKELLKTVEKISSIKVDPLFSQPLASNLAIKEVDTNPYTKVVANAQAAAEAIKAAEEDVARKREESLDRAMAVGDAVGSVYAGFTGSIIDSLGLAKTGMEGFVGALAGTITKLIAMMLSSAVAQSIAGATASGTATGPAAVFTTPAFISTAVGGVLGAFAAIPKFAEGGLAFGASLGMVGEGRGTSLTNPEVIAPLDKLKSFINPEGSGGGGIVKFEIEGQVLRGVLNRYDKQNSF